MTARHPLVVLLTNEVNWNFRLFGFGVKARLVEGCGGKYDLTDAFGGI